MTFQGYFHILHHMGVNGQDPASPDDVKDAILEIIAETDEPNPTDEDLEEACQAFYIVQGEYDETAYVSG